MLDTSEGDPFFRITFRLVFPRLNVCAHCAGSRHRTHRRQQEHANTPELRTETRPNAGMNHKGSSSYTGGAHNLHKGSSEFTQGELIIQIRPVLRPMKFLFSVGNFSFVLGISANSSANLTPVSLEIRVKLAEGLVRNFRRI